MFWTKQFDHIPRKKKADLHSNKEKMSCQIMDVNVRKVKMKET